MRTEYGYCPYCKRYIGSGYMATEHKKLCKSVSPEVREIHGGIKHNFKVMTLPNDISRCSNERCEVCSSSIDNDAVRTGTADMGSD